MKETPSFKGASLVSETHHREGKGMGYSKVRGIGSRSFKLYMATVSQWLWPFSIGELSHPSPEPQANLRSLKRLFYCPLRGPDVVFGKSRLTWGQLKC